MTFIFRTQGISEGALSLICIGATDSLRLTLVLNYDNFVVKVPVSHASVTSGDNLVGPHTDFAASPR